MPEDFNGSFAELSEVIKEKGIQFIDFKVVDPIGKWRHITIPESKFTRSYLSRGIGFDGSSYGYRSVENSIDKLLPFAPFEPIDRVDPLANGRTTNIKFIGKFSLCCMWTVTNLVKNL